LDRHRGWGCLLPPLNGGSIGRTLYKKGVGPDTTQHRREAEGDAMASVHDELEADEEARQQAHYEYGGRPCSPCNGAEECDQRKDSDEERKEGKARGEGEEEVRAI